MAQRWGFKAVTKFVTKIFCRTCKASNINCFHCNKNVTKNN